MHKPFPFSVLLLELLQKEAPDPFYCYIFCAKGERRKTQLWKEGISGEERAADRAAGRTVVGRRMLAVRRDAYLEPREGLGQPAKGRGQRRCGCRLRAAPCPSALASC